MSAHQDRKYQKDLKRMFRELDTVSSIDTFDKKRRIENPSPSATEKIVAPVTGFGIAGEVRISEFELTARLAFWRNLCVLSFGMCAVLTGVIVSGWMTNAKHGSALAARATVTPPTVISEDRVAMTNLNRSPSSMPDIDESLLKQPSADENPLKPVDPWASEGEKNRDVVAEARSVSARPRVRATRMAAPGGRSLASKPRMKKSRPAAVVGASAVMRGPSR